MSSSWQILLIPFIGALIGWLTNRIAIKMLFWPKLPIRILGTKWEIIGVLPKRRNELAFSVGKAIDSDLLPIEEVLSKVGDYEQYLLDKVTFHVDERLRAVLPTFIPNRLEMVIRDYLRDIIVKEAGGVMGQLSSAVAKDAKTKFRLGPLVEEKIKLFNLDKLEDLIKSIAASELRHIELFGALLGFVIGIAQSLV